ncbi:MAG: hypothetical protein A3B66_06950 [Alphaproteobacteria bacterium RIFCSPHIGHO2_02_FULL_46_13]|nr:MAG: hypothetical protein A3B66_06950 [Alphaproteobacteria bacterium RIFCSPHIGHO2_02_FULL_46_13]
MKKYCKLAMLLMVAALPSRLKIIFYNQFMGGDIHPSAKIGFSLIDAKKIKMGANASIGHLNIIRGLELLDMGENSIILKQNSITALALGDTVQFAAEHDRFPALILGAHSAIVSKHFLDCNNTIVIGHHTTIAGLGTAFFTHGINIGQNRQESAPIRIGDYCMVGAMCCILKNSQMPDYSVLAAGSTWRGGFDTPYALYSGVPAAHIKNLNPESLYFHRAVGYVD